MSLILVFTSVIFNCELKPINSTFSISQPVIDAIAKDISVDNVPLRDVSPLVPINKSLNLLLLMVSLDDVLTDNFSSFSSFTFSAVTDSFAFFRAPFLIVNDLFTVAL